MSIYPSPTGVMIGMDLAHNRPEAAHPTSHGKYHEGESCVPRSSSTYPEVSSAVLLGAHGALLEQPELLGALLEPNHLVRRRHQRVVPCHNSQDLRG